jgi:hypothetical protein
MGLVGMKKKKRLWIAAMYNYVNRRLEIVDKEAQAIGCGHNLSVPREGQRT